MPIPDPFIKDLADRFEQVRDAFFSNAAEREPARSLRVMTSGFSAEEMEAMAVGAAKAFFGPSWHFRVVPDYKANVRVNTANDDKGTYYAEMTVEARPFKDDGS